MLYSGIGNYSHYQGKISDYLINEFAYPIISLILIVLFFTLFYYYTEPSMERDFEDTITNLYLLFLLMTPIIGILIYWKRRDLIGNNILETKKIMIKSISLILGGIIIYGIMGIDFFRSICFSHSIRILNIKIPIYDIYITFIILLIVNILKMQYILLFNREVIRRIPALVFSLTVIVSINLFLLNR
jgi:hypothetical protein